MDYYYYFFKFELWTIFFIQILAHVSLAIRLLPTESKILTFIIQYRINMYKGIYYREMLMSTERCSLRMIYCRVHLMKICINYKWTEILK